MRLLLLFLVITLTSCGGGGGGTSSGGGPAGPNDGNANGTNSVFTQKITQNELAIFARSDVSSSFLTNVGKAYESMLQSSASINTPMRNNYNSTLEFQ